MTLFSRIQHLFQAKPEERVLGYSLSELQRLFPHPAVFDEARSSRAYPQQSSLASAAIHAVHVKLLICNGELAHWMARVDAGFVRESTRQFQGAPVSQNNRIEGLGRLCFLVSDAFQGHAVQCVTDCLDFLDDIDQYGFAPPPPWVAFKGYNPAWWGGAMQGEQGYYDESYFSPFFLSLDAAGRQAYCATWGATPEWERALALFYDDADKA